MANCYLCGFAATKPLVLKDSFTSHSAAKCPQSQYMCDRCDWCINLRCWYYNSNKEGWSKLFSRNWSWLLSADDSFPKFEGSRGEGKENLLIVSQLPTRILIRQWLVEPPKPPFTIAIAESGQKHILPWSQEALSRDRFPILFEQDILHIDRKAFINLLNTYESLMGMDFSKTEIDSGEWHSDRLLKVLSDSNFWELEKQIERIRNTRLLALISYVAQKPKFEEIIQNKFSVEVSGQMTLF